MNTLAPHAPLQHAVGGVALLKAPPAQRRTRARLQ